MARSDLRVFYAFFTRFLRVIVLIPDTKTMIDSLIQITNNREAMVLQNDVNSCLLVSANHALRWNAIVSTRIGACSSGNGSEQV